jgi:hypothetical protein
LCALHVPVQFQVVFLTVLHYREETARVFGALLPAGKLNDAVGVESIRPQNYLLLALARSRRPIAAVNPRP